MISQSVFKAFYSKNINLTDDLQVILLCDVLHLSYTDLIKQPLWWVLKYPAYLEGKSKAEEANMKKDRMKNRPQYRSVNRGGR